MRSPTPATHVALLRGINVGRAKRIAMADLRALLAELGYGDVRTLLNSGNAIFTAAGKATDIAERIESALEGRLGVSSRVTTLTAGELATAVRDNPLTDVASNPSRLIVAVLRSAAARRSIEPLARQTWTPEAFALGKRVAYLWCPDGVLASPLFDAVGDVVGDEMTTRNWSTFTKLNALAQV